MVNFPICKINIGLRILSKRNDGYHDLETIFYPVPGLTDALEIVISDSDTDILFSQSGNVLPGKDEDNLCVKAYRLIKSDFPKIPHVKMHLHKCIPDKAGLGGGSSDAAHTLLLLNTKLALQLNEDTLEQYAQRLGSDCPFFIRSKACHALGKGERMQEVALDLQAYKLLIVHPGKGISTKMAFASIKPSDNHSHTLAELIGQPVSAWKDHIFNDFEPFAIATWPEIGDIKNLMYQKGALYASLTGSGSAVFGIFEEEITLPFPSGYFYKWI